jgi:uncharacterized protein (TIGR02231 family)
MKKILIAFCLVLSSNCLHATEKEIIKSTLTDVTVYAQGAQLHHKANYSVKIGVTEIIIEGISSFIDPKSIQVKGIGDLVILDTRYSLFYPQPNYTNNGLDLKTKRDIQLLEDSLRIVGYDLQDIQDEINVLVASKQIISSNGMVRSIGKVNDSINLLKQTVEYYATKMTELNKKLLALEKKKQEKMMKKTAMDTRLNDLRNYLNNNGVIDNNLVPIPRITITVSAKTAVTGKLNFSYVVSNAGWTPLYDLRSDSNTGKINLTYKAQVYQTTGLDWENVGLTISTNNPNVNKTKPTLNPWYIDYNLYKLESDKKGKMDQLQEVQVTSQALFNRGYAYGEEQDDAKNIMGADEFTTVVHRLISAEFKIDLPYSIKSNSDSHIVLIKTAELDTKFKYYAVPKLDASVYLVAQMTKLENLQLVPGQANIFFDGSYIGETYIDPTNMDDTLNLSLGKDPSIIVKRTLLKKELKDKIIGDKRERTFAYSIEISNQKSSAIDIVVQDQLPITQNGEITIESDNFAKGRFDDRTGLLEWSFTLKPKEKKVIDYDFKVKHPKDKNLEIY